MILAGELTYPEEFNRILDSINSFLNLYTLMEIKNVIKSVFLSLKESFLGLWFII